MTCVVAIAHDGAVTMGADSAEEMNGRVWIAREPKIFVRGGLIVGASGGSNLMQILLHLWHIPSRYQPTGSLLVPSEGAEHRAVSGRWRELMAEREKERDRAQSDLDYLARLIVPSIWDIATQQNYLKIEDEIHFLPDEAELLIGYRGAVYHLDSSLSITSQDEGYEAIGSGGKIALGVFYATKPESALTAEEQRSPMARIVVALAAAARFDLNVRGPFHTATLESVADPS